MSSRRGSGQTGVGDTFTISTALHGTDLIVTTANGIVNSSFAIRLRAELLGELGIESRNWIFDASGIEKFDRDTAAPLVDILRAFKDRGGGKVIVIIGENLKMMLSSIGMSSVAHGGPPLEIVKSLEEAMERLGRFVSRKAGQ